MEGSVQTEQALLDELEALRARVLELEQVAEIQRQKLISEQQMRLELEATLQQQAVEVPACQELQQGKISITEKSVNQVREFGTIFDALTDALCVYDVAGNVVRTNQAFRSLMGMSGDASYATLPLEKRGAAIHIADEQGQPLPVECWPLSRVLHGAVLTGQNVPDITVSTLDGRTLQLSASGAPLHDEQGTIIGGVMIYRDVTERHRLEKHSQDILQALLAMAEILVKVVGAYDVSTASEGDAQSSLGQVVRRLAKLARRVLDCQCVSVTLVEPETGLLHLVALVGKVSGEQGHWAEQIEGTRLSDHIADPQGLDDLAAGKPLWLNINKPGLAANACCLLLPMRIGTPVIGLLALDYGKSRPHFTDDEIAVAKAVSRLIALVLERERLLQERAEAHANELALRESNRRADEFLSIASHELRTPLTTINGNIQLAKRRVRTLTKDEPQDSFDNKLDLVVELLGRAERQVRVQNRLVSDLLDVSRIQSNRLELRSDACDLATIVHECVEDQRSSNLSRTLTLTLPQGEVPILADPDRIAQVVTNYLTNALKYSAASMPVEVHFTVENGFARVAVRDRGPGLPPEEQERLWERFYRVPGVQALSGSGMGLGLGLYICRTIIERHQGQVGVQSAPGHGSTFWFTLPLRAERDEEAR